MSRDEQQERKPDSSAPASESNRARQSRSRLNITHPVRFTDEELEKAYNRERSVPKSDRKSELRRLHRRFVSSKHQKP